MSMSDKVLIFALFCLAVIAGGALFFLRESGAEIASGAIGAIAGAISVRVVQPAVTDAQN